MSSAPPSAAIASREAAAATAAAVAASFPAAVPPAPVHLDHAFLPPFLAHLLNGGTAPYTTMAPLGPLQSRSAGALYAGPVSSLYADASLSSSPAATRPPQPPPPPAATSTAAHPMVRAVVPAPVAPIYTAAGPADAAPAAYGGYGSYSGYPLYGAPYGPLSTALPSYGAFHSQGVYAAPPQYGAPPPYGAPSRYGAPHAYGAPLMYAAATAPSAPAPPPAPYVDVEASLAAISSPLFLFSHLLPVKLKPDNYLYWHAQSTAQSMAIRTKLGETRKENGTVTAYYNKVKKLADTLASIGEPLRDTEFTAYILAGLDSEYDGRPRACCAACGAAQPCQLCGLAGHVASRCHRRFKTDFLGLGNNGKGNDRQVHMAQKGHTPSYSVDPSWYMDTGATYHVTSELDKLAVQQPYHGHDKVHTANGAVARNLLSVPRLTQDNNVFCEFHPFYLFVKGRATRNVLLRGRYRHGLYALDEPSVASAPAAEFRVFSGVRVSLS
ncbi:hypothetical protein ACQ4PT_056836 [Festuca glaucescens]